MRSSHVTQLPTGPVGVEARGAASGAAIYCDYADFSGGSFFGGTASVTFSTSARSTFNVQIVWEFASSSGNASWSLEQNDRSSYVAIIPTPNNSIVRSEAFTTTLTVAATRDAGTWTVTASGVDGLSGGKVYLVVIVGSNTEQDDVTYSTGL